MGYKQSINSQAYSYVIVLLPQSSTFSTFLSHYTSDYFIVVVVCRPFEPYPLLPTSHKPMEKIPISHTQLFHLACAFLPSIGSKPNEARVIERAHRVLRMNSPNRSAQDNDTNHHRTESPPAAVRHFALWKCS